MQAGLMLAKVRRLDRLFHKGRPIGCTPWATQTGRAGLICLLQATVRYEVALGDI